MNPKDKPIQFIFKDKLQNGKWTLNPEAKKILTGHSKPVKVLCIVGKYREGKSYILNAYLGFEKGFYIGHTVNGETKGIWIWLKEEKDHTLILLDTEGLFDVENPDGETDAHIFLLSMLLASYLIVNVRGTLDTNIIEDCHVVTEMAQRIKVTDDDSVSQENVINHTLPKLLFLLRDFHLNLGEFKDSTEYLIKTLGKTEIVGKSNSIKEAKKKLRNEVKEFFLNCFKGGLGCMTLPCPVNDMEKNLQKMETDPSVVKKEFKDQVAYLVEKISNELDFKKMVNCHNVEEFTELTGDSFLKMTENYIDQLNNDESFNIGSTFELVLASQTNQLFSIAISEYEGGMKSLSETFPVKRQDFYERSDSLLLECTKKATEKAFIHSKQKLLDQLKDEAKKISEIYYHKNIEKGEEECERLWSILSQEFFSRFDENSTDKFTTIEEAGEKALDLKEVFSLKINMTCPIEVTQKAEIEKKKLMEDALYKLQNVLKLSDMEKKIFEQERKNQEREMLQQQEIDRIEEQCAEQQRLTEIARKEQMMMAEQFKIEKEKFEAESKRRDKEFNERMQQLMIENKALGERLLTSQQKAYDDMEKMRKEHMDEMKNTQREFYDRQEKLQASMNARVDELNRRNQELLMAMQNQSSGGCIIS